MLKHMLSLSHMSIDIISKLTSVALKQSNGLENARLVLLHFSRREKSGHVLCVFSIITKTQLCCI